MSRKRCSKSIEWSKKVRERDNHTCKNCGYNGRTDAHHIIPWRMNESLRFDVNNGITLCRSCHSKIEGFKKGHRHSQEIKKKLSDAKKGIIPWNKGKKTAPNTIEKLRLAKIGHIPWNKGKVQLIPEIKKCKICGIEKNINEFTPMEKGLYRSSKCRPCRNAYLRVKR